MSSIRNVVVKIAELCNLNCAYCYMYHHVDKSYLRRPKFMEPAVFRQLLNRMRAYADRYPGHRMSLTFHGGEPTLVGPLRFRNMCREGRLVMGDRLNELVLQTNGTLIDAEWIAVLQDEGVAVAVSLDGPRWVHDRERVDHAGQGSYERVLRGIDLLREAGLFHGVLSVVTPGVSGSEVYKHFRSLSIQRMSFLFPDVSRDTKAQLYGGYGSTPVADFLLPVLHAWLKEDDPTVRVGPLWTLIAVMLGGESDIDLFGNDRLTYIVVESDGNIHALDTLRVCEEGLGDSGLNVMTDDFADLARASPLLRLLLEEGLPLCAECRRCSDLSVCGGGYVPHRYSTRNGFDNPSAWCDDIKRLLAGIRAEMSQYANVVGSGFARSLPG